MKLIFVRHGQTDWNREKKLMGRADIELNEEGRAQCQLLLEKLEPDFDVILSSPLKRALQTAEVIAERFGKEIIIEHALIERNFGSLAGKTWEQVEEQTGINMKALTEKEQYDFRPYGGESAQDVKARLVEFISELRTRPYSKVVIACHSGIMSMIHHITYNDEAGEPDNATVREFEI